MFWNLDWRTEDLSNEHVVYTWLKHSLLEEKQANNTFQMKKKSKIASQFCWEEASQAMIRWGEKMWETVKGIKPQAHFYLSLKMNMDLSAKEV